MQEKGNFPSSLGKNCGGMDGGEINTSDLRSAGPGPSLAIALFSQTRNLAPLFPSSPRGINKYWQRHSAGGNPVMK